MARNTHLNNARKRSNDEFYTRRETIERELRFYEEELRGKVVYCNCDDYRYSQFYKYFKENFERLGLKELISSNYSTEGEAYIVRFEGDSERITHLTGSGSY